MQQREAELTAVRDRFRSGCGCSLNCFADFNVQEVADARISLKRLPKAECDMLLLGKLQTFYKPPQEGSSVKEHTAHLHMTAERSVKVHFVLFMVLVIIPYVL